MGLLLSPRNDEREGDFRRRLARVAGYVLILMLPVATGLFANLEALWSLVLPLEGGLFVIASALLGGALAVAPIVAVAALLVMVWHGVESVYLGRSRATPMLDRLIVALGVLVWFAPALAMLVAAVRAVLTGAVGFSRPQREYLLATDPIAFWQSVGFFLIVAAALAYPAWQYWRRKLGQR